MKDNLKQLVAHLGLGHYSDSKDTSLLVKNDLQKTKVNISDWLAERPDFNSISNVWGERKTKVHARRPSNLEELKRCNKDKWARIAQEICVGFVENYKKNDCSLLSSKKDTQWT